MATNTIRFVSVFFFFTTQSTIHFCDTVNFNSFYSIRNIPTKCIVFYNLAEENLC